MPVDLPRHQIRYSQRAKHLQLKYTPQAGVILIVPNGVSIVQAQKFLYQKRDWVEKVQANYPPLHDKGLPSEIYFPAFNLVWRVHYQPLYKPMKKWIETDKLLMLTIHKTSKVTGKKMLRQWLLEKAEALLLPMLQSLSKATSLRFEHAKVSFTETRWGSCDQNKVIALNPQLLFLSKNLIQHVIIHELAHTRYMDHSDKFWRLVTQYDPNCQMHRAALKHSQQQLPLWLTKQQSLQPL